MGTKSPCFGIAPGSYDNGVTPACAMNSGNTVVEVHVSSSVNSNLWWWVGENNNKKLGGGGTYHHCHHGALLPVVVLGGD